MAIINQKKPKSPPKVSDAEGQDYILSSFNYLTPWDTKNLTIEDIEKYKDHWVSDLIRDSLKNMIFQGQPIINALENGKSREDYAEMLRNVADKIDLLDLMKTQYDDECNYGTYLRSVGWERIDGNVTITEVRCLPPYTFRSPGKYSLTDCVYGQILKGIMKYKDETTHYWQTKSYTANPIELTNCEHIKSPKSSYYLDGVPILNPLYQLLPDLNLAKAGLMQANKRANILFVRDNKIGNDKMPDGKGSRFGYIKEILRKLSNNVWFPLAAEMEPIELKGQVSKISIDSIYLLIKLILMCYSPSSFLSMGETNRLGGSTSGETTLMKSYVFSQHAHITKTWETLFQKLLEYNYIYGVKVQIILPQIKEDNDQLNFQIASKILDAAGQHGIVIAEINEVREKCGLEDISEKALQKALKSWKAVKMVSDKEIAINVPDESIKHNQAPIDTREEIQEDLEQDLDGAIEGFFKNLKRIKV